MPLKEPTLGEGIMNKAKAKFIPGMEEEKKKKEPASNVTAAGAIDRELWFEQLSFAFRWGAMHLLWDLLEPHWAPFVSPWAAFGPLWGALRRPRTLFGYLLSHLGIPWAPIL